MKKKTKHIIISLSIIGSLLISIGVAIPIVIDIIDNPNPPKVDSNKKLVACVGDSITYGLGTLFFRYTKSYPALLNKELGNEYQVLNYGLSGRTLLDEGDRPYTKESFYNISHEVKADTYIIMLGTNDSKDHNWSKAGNKYKEELKAFVNSYISLDNSPTVYVMKPPRAFLDSRGNKPYDIDNEIIKNEIYNQVEEVANELNITSIDLYNITKDHPEYFMDGIHPNSKGNEVIAKYIYSIIK